MTADNIDLVCKFCEAVSRRDPDEILTFFTEDAVYHNMPVAPVQGNDGIRSVLDMFLKPSQAVEFEILNISASGNVVLTERLDKFSMGDRSVELPVAGVFEVEEGKISAWRDYFDLVTGTSGQRGGSQKPPGTPWTVPPPIWR
jgi:limonene-1,2-epoxide hydrolase